MSTFTLLNAATATGAGDTADVLNLLPTQHTFQASMGGTVVATAVTFDIEGSVDGKTWFQLLQHAFTAGEITAEAAMVHLVDRAIPYIRANLITLTGGTAPTVTILYAPDRRSTS